MRLSNNVCRLMVPLMLVPVIYLASGVVLAFCLIFHDVNAKTTYEFDGGIEYLTNSLLENANISKDAKIAVFGIVESHSRKPWKISPEIEAGIIDTLSGLGFTVLARHRIIDIIKKEQSLILDDAFDESKFKEVGRLAGADILVTGRHLLWNNGRELKINIKAVDAESGKLYAARKVYIEADRIASLLQPVIATPVSQPVNDRTSLPANRDTVKSAKTKTNVIATNSFHLTIGVVPADAQIRILNIKPRYWSGISLQPGRYHVEVSKPGYKTVRKWFEVADSDIQATISLTPEILPQPINLPALQPSPVAIDGTYGLLAYTENGLPIQTVAQMEIVLVALGNYQFNTVFQLVDQLNRQITLTYQGYMRSDGNSWTIELTATNQPGWINEGAVPMTLSVDGKMLGISYYYANTPIAIIWQKM